MMINPLCSLSHLILTITDFVGGIICMFSVGNPSSERLIICLKLTEFGFQDSLTPKPGLVLALAAHIPKPGLLATL